MALAKACESRLWSSHSLSSCAVTASAACSQSSAVSGNSTSSVALPEPVVDPLPEPLPVRAVLSSGSTGPRWMKASSMAVSRCQSGPATIALACSSRGPVSTAVT